MLDRLKDWALRVVTSEPFVRARRTWVQSFVPLFLLAVLGLLADLNEWVSGEAEFPSLTAFGAALLAAAISSCIAAVTLLQNWWEQHRAKADA